MAAKGEQMNLELLYDDNSNVFMEGVTNISVSPTHIYFEGDNEPVTIYTKDLITFTLRTDDWQETIRHWVF